MLYKFDQTNPERSEKIDIKSPADFGIKEEDIENFLKTRLADVVSEDHLMLIGQERSRQEEADLLALDKSGFLYIFELKRWGSDPENLLQVMRYGQIFGRYSYRSLEDLARRQQGLQGSLKEVHKEYFGLENVLLESKFNDDQVFVLVTHGVDSNTISAIDYWSKKGIRIECSPYRVYDIDGAPYIQFDTYNPDHETVYEQNTKYFIANTNKTYMPHAWSEMLHDFRTGKASAYYNRKHAIRIIPEHSVVYLYHTQTGIIAKGTSTSSWASLNFEDDEDEENCVYLTFDWALPEDEWATRAVAAREINEALGSGHRFRKTAFSISRGMAETIDSIYENKCTPSD